MLLSASSPSLCDREEWAWLQSHVCTTTGSVQNLLGSKDECLTETGALTEFSRSLRAAVTHLLTKLNIPLYRVTPATATSKLSLILSHLFQNCKDKVKSNFYKYIYLCVCSVFTGLPIWRVHPWASAVWRQGLHVAAAASKWGFQLQLLAFGGHQRARPHHAPADLWAG